MTWVLIWLTICKNSIFCRFHHFLSIPCILFWWKSLLFHHLQKFPHSPLEPHGFKGRLRWRYLAFCWCRWYWFTLRPERFAKDPKKTSYAKRYPPGRTNIHIPYQRQFLSMILHLPRYVTSLQGTCTSIALIHCWLPLLGSTWRCCIRWFLDLKGKCIITSELQAVCGIS